MTVLFIPLKNVPHIHKGTLLHFNSGDHTGTHIIQSFTTFVHLYALTAGSMIRKKQLEEWLKGREEKKRLENKEKKKKPFYAGSRNITTGSSFSVTTTTHVCCHGTKVKVDPPTMSKSVVVAVERNAKDKTKNTTHPSRYAYKYTPSGFFLIHHCYQSINRSIQIDFYLCRR